MSQKLDLREQNGSVSFEIVVQPRATRNQLLAGEYDGALRVKIAAPPVEGKANDECIRFMAELLKVSRNSIAILKGKSSKRKVISISGVNAQQVRQALGLESRG